MTQDMRIQVEIPDIFRHGLAIIFLAISWIFLTQWYLYRSNNDYLIFAALFVAAILLAAFKKIRFLLSKTTPQHLLILIGIIFVSLPWSEWLRQNPPASREDWSRQIYLQSITLYGLFLLFHFAPSIPQTLEGLTNAYLEYVQSKNYLLYLPSILFFLITAFISVFVYKKTLLVQDSAAHLFQAKIFSEWKLYAPVPSVPDFFSCAGDMLVMKDGRWFSMYTPGFSLLLALAMFLRGEWILSPLLGAFTITIWICYAARWHGKRVAAILGALCLFSPFLLVMSSTIMVHTPELFIASASLYLCRLEMEHPDPWKKAALFLLMVFAILTRLFSLSAFLGPILVYTCWLRIKAKDWKYPAIIAAGLCTGALLLAFYQSKTTGNPLQSGYFLEYKDLRLGFGSNFGGRIHTPLKGLENVSNNFLGINSWLTGWYAGALFFVGAFLVSRTKFQTWDRVLLLSSFLVVSFYFLYVIQALIFGPRSYFVLAPFLLLLIARSSVRENESGDWFDQKIILALLVVALVSFFPKRLPEFVTRYFPDRLQAGDLKKEVQRIDQTKTLVFLEEIGPQYVDWNDPFLRNPALLCRNLKSRNSEAISAFPGYRPMYFRMNVSFGKSLFDSGYKLQDKPNDKRPGYLSLFQLALAVETDKYPDKDFYDVCYEGFFNENNAAEQLQYLHDESKKEVQENIYKRNFRMAIISVGRLLLLPKAAFEKDDQNWEKSLDLDQVRKDFQNAIQYSKSSGEVGKAISKELEKVERRIDQDHDGKLSDQELLNFLNEKIQILKLA